MKGSEPLEEEEDGGGDDGDERRQNVDAAAANVDNVSMDDAAAAAAAAAADLEDDDLGDVLDELAQLLIAPPSPTPNPVPPLFRSRFQPPTAGFLLLFFWPLCVATSEAA